MAHSSMLLLALAAWEAHPQQAERRSLMAQLAAGIVHQQRKDGSLRASAGDERAGRGNKLLGRPALNRACLCEKLPTASAAPHPTMVWMAALAGAPELVRHLRFSHNLHPHAAPQQIYFEPENQFDSGWQLYGGEAAYALAKAFGQLGEGRLLEAATHALWAYRGMYQ